MLLTQYTQSVHRNKSERVKETGDWRSLTFYLQHVWKFAQCFGDKDDSPLLYGQSPSSLASITSAISNSNSADVISTVEFNDTGDFLATGDYGGRVVLFERVRSDNYNGTSTQCEYKFLAEFQSHSPEFDILYSTDIEEHINKIKWLPQRYAGSPSLSGSGSGSGSGGQQHLMLTTNDKTIKLWKVWEKSIQLVVSNNAQGSAQQQRQQQNAFGSSMAATYGLNPFSPTNAFVNSFRSTNSNSIDTLRFPQLVTTEPIMSAQEKRKFPSAHHYTINSLSINADQEIFLSADDLRVNLWNLRSNVQSFTMFDLKPDEMKDLKEVITTAEFHPGQCNLMMFGSSKGTIRVCDLRDGSYCILPATNFFSEIVASISDAKFCPFPGHERLILTRDYMSLRLWDLAMPAQPLKTIVVHDYIRSKMCDLYDNDDMFDKFECFFGHGNANESGLSIMTGTYNNYLALYDINSDGSGEDVLLHADRNVFRSRRTSSAVSKMARSLSRASSTASINSNNGGFFLGAPDPSSENDEANFGSEGWPDSGLFGEVNVNMMDFKRKILHASYHPREDIIAVAANTNLFTFTK
ncbi:protein phosphatase 2A regulatory subunit PR55 [Ramicandelaber brevisporus]|nr:protein phosphatase 2A regulatory subunit PR55 [Ramicandelaber brevisporus]